MVKSKWQKRIALILGALLATNALPISIAITQWSGHITIWALVAVANAWVGGAALIAWGLEE